MDPGFFMGVASGICLEVYKLLQFVDLDVIVAIKKKTIKTDGLKGGWLASQSPPSLYPPLLLDLEIRFSC